MRNNFVDYVTALRLKLLGFNENCLAYYKVYYHDTTIEKAVLLSEFQMDISSMTFYTNVDSLTEISAPLYQQVLDWLDSKNIIVQPTLIRQFFSNEWGYNIAVNGSTYSRVYDEDESYPSRREALIAGINKALEILEKQYAESNI